jgi:Family of unknown function (DUF6477)
VPGKPQQKHREQRETAKGAKPKRVFATMANAGAGIYLRARDLPKLIALWPCELADEPPEGSLRVLAKLRRALRAERRRGGAGHWSYDLNRHLGLLSAYKAELAALRSRPPQAQSRDKSSDSEAYPRWKRG